MCQGANVSAFTANNSKIYIWKFNLRYFKFWNSDSSKGNFHFFATASKFIKPFSFFFQGRKNGRLLLNFTNELFCGFVYFYWSYFWNIKSLINLRFAWRDIPIGGRALGDIALWSKNLLDEEYAVTVLGVLPHSNRAVFWGEPRSAGMDFKLSF